MNGKRRLTTYFVELFLPWGNDRVWKSTLPHADIEALFPNKETAFLDIKNAASAELGDW